MPCYTLALAALLGLCATLVAAAGNGGDEALLQPAALDFADLAGGRTAEALREALQTDGLLQVTGIPQFAKLREEALRAAHGCIKESPRAGRHSFADGTLRLTLAAATGTFFGDRPIDHGSFAAPCRALDTAWRALRATVGGTADLFAKQLDVALGLDWKAEAQLLPRVGGGGYHSIEEAVQAGERLEHFHSYRMPVLAGSDAGHEAHTLDFHVDQGLFIAFVPALMVDDSASPYASTASGAFVVTTLEGHEQELSLRQDALVFLLGDGVNQYINKVHRGAPLRAPSHAFRMPRGPPGLHRVWYGMMQLPPADAKDEELGLSFGEVREQMVQALGVGVAASEPALALGCSRKLKARELMASCADNQVFCWHRCFNHTQQVSPTACAAQNLDYKCVNQFDQVYVSGHGDFVPKCSNASQPVTPRAIVQQPCGACSEWEGLVADTNYDNRVALANRTYFLWKELAGGEIMGKMIHKGRVGWMAVGIEKVGGDHNGMNGASIVMGRNLAGNQTIGEYRIHERDSAFRHWKDPLSPSSLQDAEMQVTNCYSSIKFRATTIHNTALTTTTPLIWALTHLDYPTDDFGGYSGYHSATNSDPQQRNNFRGHFNLSSYVGGDFAEYVPPNCVVGNDFAVSYGSIAAVPCTILVSTAALLWVASWA